jgi:hypothetical protein
MVSPPTILPFRGAEEFTTPAREEGKEHKKGQGCVPAPQDEKK